MRKKRELLSSNKSKSNYHSILQKHEEKMEEFKNKDKLIKEYNNKIANFLKEIETLKKSAALSNINNKRSEYDSNILKISKIENDIKELSNIKNKLESGDTETKYILDTFTYINDYLELEEREQYILKNQKSQNEDDDTTIEQQLFEINIKKKNIADEYMRILDPNFSSLRNLYTNESTICKNCGDKLLIESGFAICYTCGHCYDAVHEASEPSYKEMQDMDYRPQFTYDKRTHLEEWLRRFQAKENKEIPQEILDKVILEAKKERITNLNLLTEDKVKKYLKKLNLNDYYDNVISIINRINKRPPFVLTKEVEEKIKEMFQQIQDPFEKFKDPKRKNMLSYSFLLHKFFLILGLPEFSKYFFLLKSPEKLRQQDETFKKIVDHMAKVDPKTPWKFYPSL